MAADGSIQARHSVPTPAQQGAAAVLDALAIAAEAVRAPTAREAGTGQPSLPDTGVVPRAEAIGVAAAGVIDPVSGTVTSATDTLRGWAGTALADELSSRTGLPVACDNDVRAAAYTELTHLDERSGSLVYAAVGTGVGGAVAAAGHMLHGAAGIAGHLGHLPVPEAAGLPCTCGAEGHLEAIAAGPAIAARYARVTGTAVGPLQRVASYAAHGDPHAVSAITFGARAVGRALGGLANAFGPELVVVTGGVTRIGDLYWNALCEAFAGELMPPIRDLRISPPRVGHDAAVLGAASLTRILPLHTHGTAGVPR
ncbi:ROK family protein [Streptomyces sp. NPDC050418]|uniref:ROK family protein n=1 Tax=Streptomyces sp. NPDC050418 TaxID=3365612 RepID=UPI0037BB9D09